MVEYCVSLLIVTLQRASAVHFIRPGEGRIGPGLKYTLISLLAGWWGIPWGPIYTVGACYTNCCGGRDVTEEMLFPDN